MKILSGSSFGVPCRIFEIKNHYDLISFQYATVNKIYPQSQSNFKKNFF